MTAWLRDQWPRLLSGLALVAVAAVAGTVSYLHIESLTIAEHQTAIAARLYPVGVDGLIVSGSVVLLRNPGWLGWVAVGPGVAISLFANVMSGIGFGVLPAVWAGVPAVAFALSTFVLERWLSTQADRRSGAVGRSPGPEPVPSPVPAVANGHGTGTTWAAASTSSWS